MIHNRKQAEQALNEILLRMSYDLGKTLSENKSLLSEQQSPIYFPESKPLYYYYYDKNGDLKILPNSVTRYPDGSTPAQKAYPNITNGLAFPKKYNQITSAAAKGINQQDIGMSNQRYQDLNPPKPKSKPETQIPEPNFRYTDNYGNTTPTDATYVTRQYGSNNSEEPDVDWRHLNNYGYTSPQDATYVSPDYIGIKDPEMVKMAKKWQEEKRNSKPIEPKSEVIMYDPNKYPHPTPKWIYNGKKYVRKEDALAQYENDLNEWKKKYADGFEGWLARNSEAIHTVLGYAALGLALISITASVVLTGGLSIPALGLSLEGATGAASLLLTTADAGLYAYEGDTRMAVFVGLLGLFDVAQILKAVKGLKVLQSEMSVIRNKAIQNTKSLTNGSTKLTDIFTEREIQILKSIDPAVIRGEAQILGRAALKQAVKELGYWMIKSPAHFAASLLKLKTYGLLGKYFIAIDGIQLSYNAIYNALSGEDKELQSLTLLLLDYAFSKPEIKEQIQINNISIEEDIEAKPESEAAEILASATGLDTGVKLSDGGSESLKDVTNRLNGILQKMKIEEKEKQLLPGTVKTYNNVTGTVPFKTQEEGNKFREWFNTEFPTMAKLIELDSEGSFNNNYIKRAYNIPMGSVGIIGDIYNQEIINIDNDTENETSSYFD